MSDLSMIGAYGGWAASLVGEEPAALSFRKPQWNNVDEWRPVARQRVLDCLAMPNAGSTPVVTVNRSYQYDGLQVEELSWQLPYGPVSEGLLLKPAGATDRLPAILALHDHGGQKVFGKEKIARTGDNCHPILIDHMRAYYGGVGWANELAKQGFVVLIPDAFAFGSRRVRIADLSPAIRPNIADDDRSVEGIAAYNRWAGEHESILAKSLFCAGTTWPGAFLVEDQRALDVLCARADVDAAGVGCGGLSGGGLRTVYLAGIDERVRCAVCVGMMTTWRDYLLHKSVNHTWMIYIPHLAHDLDYAEILGLRAPLPTLVLNDLDDELFTLPEMRRADGMLQQVFDKAGAPDRYRCSYYPGPHKFDLEMQAEAFDWFGRWLV